MAECGPPSLSKCNTRSNNAILIVVHLDMDLVAHADLASKERDCLAPQLKSVPFLVREHKNVIKYSAA
jgi:hypothetical protein